MISFYNINSWRANGFFIYKLISELLLDEVCRTTIYSFINSLTYFNKNASYIRIANAKLVNLFYKN